MAGACFSSDTSCWPPCEAASASAGTLMQVQKGMTSASGSGQPVHVWASTSNVFLSFHEHRETIYYTVALVKNMLTGDAFQTSASKLTWSWCLLADVSFDFKLSALQGKCLLSYASWFQPPKPLLEINPNHGTSALELKPKSTILMPSITNMLFFTILL